MAQRGERPSERPAIAIALGDPAGIGPEIAIKAACDPRIEALCRPILVGHDSVVRHYCDRLAPSRRLRRIDDPSEAGIDPGAIDLVAEENVALGDWTPGRLDASCGRAALAYAGRAVDLARTGLVRAAVAGPHNQSAIRAAGIDFDGYPRFVAERTDTNPDSVFLMLAGEERRIVHVTLHMGVRRALEVIRRNRVLDAIGETAAMLSRIGLRTPRIAVSGVNPHAGEGGLFGREEIDEIAPAIADARASGIDASGPFGADTMLLDRGYDAYVVMLHDQGHVPAKLVGFDSTSAVPVGVPVLFASVAHGSAFDIAGKGIADPSCLARTILRLAAPAAL
jgi:4-hydroxythreonine-4-phosphate dehydrogenase